MHALHFPHARMTPRAVHAASSFVVHKLAGWTLLLLAALWLLVVPAHAAGQLAGNADFKLLATLGFE